MRRPVLFFLIGGALIALAAAWFATRPPAITEGGNSVTVAGTTLASQTLTLPEDKATFPAGPDAALLTVNCTACHSPEMILVQPPLGTDKWQGEVDKMRKAYHATIDPKDDAKIVAALVRLQKSQGKVAAK